MDVHIKAKNFGPIEKAGEPSRAVNLYRAALSGPLRDDTREDVKNMLNACLAGLSHPHSTPLECVHWVILCSIDMLLRNQRYEARMGFPGSKACYWQLSYQSLKIEEA